MQIWPAIDIRNGQCVRLIQGDYAQETVFGDPIEIAQHWVAAGATCLHLVDLDGARAGQPMNLDAILRITTLVAAQCQWGGGLRTRSAAEKALHAGVSRVVLGSAAVANGDWILPFINEYPGRVAIAVDVRQSRVATDGWLATSDTTWRSLVSRFSDQPIAAYIFTDIDRDGMKDGPSWPTVEALRRAVTTPLIVSGGVTSTADIQRLCRMGIDGVIIGRALLDGTLTLRQALNAVQGCHLAAADSTATT